MKIIITVNPANEVSLSVDGQVSQTQLTDILCTAQLLSMNQVVAALPKTTTPQLRTKLKEHMWDTYNQSASNLLDTFMPNFQRRDLTEEAIMELETAKLAELQ
jgi:spore coat protein CotF